MAGVEANFSQNIPHVDSLPSIFQVLAHENLSSIIEPAIKHILKVLAEIKPEKFQKYFQYSDEICCFIRLLLEGYFVQKHSGSFSENFYSLQRTPYFNDGNDPSKRDQHRSSSLNKLPKHVVFKSLLFLVVIPYLKRKLDTLHRNKSEKCYKDKRLLKGKLTKAFLGIYPYMHGSLEGSTLLFQLAYAIGSSQFHSPFLYLTGVILTHRGPDEWKEEDTSSFHDLIRNGWSFQNLKMILPKFVSSLESLLAVGFSTTMFFVQFLDWWYHSDQINRSFGHLPDPVYPKGVLSDDIKKSNPGIMVLCPLCRRRRTNDTAISVSGFVFCYPCILEYVKKHSRCPVTGYPCKVEHLIKLYPTE